MGDLRHERLVAVIAMMVRPTKTYLPLLGIGRSRKLSETRRRTGQGPPKFQERISVLKNGRRSGTAFPSLIIWSLKVHLIWNL